MNDLRASWVMFGTKVVFGEASSLLTIGSECDEFFRVVEVPREVVENSDVLVGIYDFVEVAAESMLALSYRREGLLG